MLRSLDHVVWMIAFQLSKQHSPVEAEEREENVYRYDKSYVLPLSLDGQALTFLELCQDTPDWTDCKAKTKILIWQNN